MGSDLREWTGGALILASVAFPGLGPILGKAFFLAGSVLLGSGVDHVREQRDWTTMQIDPDGGVPVVYGTHRVGMTVADIRTSPEESDVLVLVGAIALGTDDGTGIEGITQVYLGDRLAIDAPVAGSNITTGVQSQFADNLRYSLYLGTDSQEADPLLVSLFAE